MMRRDKLNDPVKAEKYFSDKLAFTTGPVDVKDKLDRGERPNIIDVRTAEDFAEGHIPGAVNLPVDRWKTCQGLKKDEMNVVYCYTVVCHLSARAARFFASRGYPVREMEGGFEAWKDYEYEVERGVVEQEAKPEQQAKSGQAA